MSCRGWVSIPLLAVLTVAAGAQEDEAASIRAAYALAPPADRFRSSEGSLRWKALLGDRRLRHGSYVSAVVFGPDGRWIASGGWDGTIKVWEASSGLEIRSIDAHGGIVGALAVHRDGKLLASVGADEMVRLWDTGTGALVREFAAKQGDSVAFDPGGRFLLYADAAELHMWDLQAGALHRTLRGDFKTLSDAAFSTGGVCIVAATGDREIRVWNAEHGTQMAVIEAPRDVTCIASIGRRLFATCMGTVQVWDLVTGKHEMELQGPSFMASQMVLSPDLRHVAAVGLDKEVLVRTVGGAQVWSNQGHGSVVTSLAYSPDGRLLATGSMDTTVRLWHAGTGKPVRPPKGHTEEVVAIAFTPDGGRVASGASDGTFRIWNAASGATVHDARPHEFPLTAVVWTPDMFVTGARDWKLKLWGADGKPKGELEDDGAIFCVASVSGGRSVVAGYESGALKKWDLGTRSHTRFPPAHASQVECAAAAPDGSWVVSGDFRGTAWVHDVKELRAICRLVGHTNTIRAAAASPGGHRAATASTDGTVRIWDPRTGECQLILEHRAYTTAVAFSPDGRWIYTGRGDGRLFVWDAGTGAHVDSIVVDGVPECIAAREDLVWVGCRNSTICVYRHTPLPAKK